MLVKDECMSRMSDNTVKRTGANGVSGGAVLIAKGSNVQALWRDCLVTVGAVTAVGSVKDGVGT